MIRTARERRTRVAKGVVAVMAMVLSAATPRAETGGANKIHNIDVKEQGGKTVVAIAGSERPSFTAFRLNSPNRLVIDLVKSQVRGLPSVLESKTDLVDGVAVSQYGVKGVPVSRVMINFRKDAAYRVRVKGNDLIATLSGSPDIAKNGSALSEEKDREARAEIEQLRKESSKHKAEAERAKAAAETAMSKLNDVKVQAEKAKAEAKMTEAKLREIADEAEQAKLAAKASEVKLQAFKEKANSASMRAKAVQTSLDSTETQVKKAKAEADSAQAELSRMRSEVAQSKQAEKEVESRLREIQAEFDKAAKEAESSQRDLASLKIEVEKSKQDAANTKTRLDTTLAAKSKAEREAQEAKTELVKYKAEAETAKKQAEEMKSNLKKLHEEAKQAKMNANSAAADLARYKEALEKAEKTADKVRNENDHRNDFTLKSHQQELASAESKMSKSEARAEAAAQVAAREKAIREKLELELVAITKERDSALTEKERIAQAKVEAEASYLRVKEALDKYKQASITADTEAREALKNQVEASVAYKNAAKEEQEKLLLVLREKERETVKARKNAEKLKEDYERAKEALGEMKNELYTTARNAKQGVANEKRLRISIERELAEAKRRFDEARRDAQRAAAQAEDARRAQQIAQKAIAEIKLETEAYKEKAAAEAQQKVAAAENQVRESKQKLSLIEDKLAAAEKKLASYLDDAKKAELRSVGLEKELEVAKRTIATQEARISELKEKKTAPQAQPSAVLASSRTVAVPSIDNIEFVNDSDLQKVVVHTSSPLEYSMSTDDTGNADIVFKDAKLAKMLERTLDVTDFNGIIGQVSSFQDGKDVKIEVAVYRTSKSTVERKKNALEFSFYRKLKDDNPKKANTGPLGAESRTVAQEDASTYDYPFERTAAYSSVKESGKKKRYTGRHIDLDFKDADIHNILRLLSDVGHVNIITADNVSGSVTIRMRDVAWDHALDIILQAKSLGMVREGNLIRVAPLSVLEKEREMEIARRQQQIALEPLETRLIPISYATADELTPQARDLLSDRGKLSVDARTNVIIARDTREVLNQIEALIRNLDTQTPQVLIEARIVEATSVYAREIGIQWGGDFAASSATGNPTGLNFPNTIGLAGGATDGQTPMAGLSPVPGAQPNPNFGVNMPAPVGTNSGGALGITLGSISNNSNLSLRLSAMEETGSVRILSSPKILTLDNKQASIQQGTQIPFSQVSAQGVQTAFQSAILQLTVKPHVTADGSVKLELTVMRNEPDFANTGARGDPTILQRQAQTELLVSDGHTAVIGGIFTRNAGTTYKKVPFFADIPIIGWLFKKKSDSDRRSEMLIFITPRIVNRAESIGR